MNAHRGFSLIELIVGIVILGVLMAMAAPRFSDWLRNARIRTSAEAIQNGLQLARAEAVRRNATVRFQLVSTIDDTCALAASGPHWVVSRNDPSDHCDVAEVTDFLEVNDTAVPQIIQKRNNADGSPNAAFDATDDGAASNTVVFNTLGRVSNATGIDRIDITNPMGTCKANGGNLRCLRVLISIGGDIRLCDPAVTIAGDTRKC